MGEPSPLPDVEALLRRAFAPVEPPEDLAQRLDFRLQSITDRAAEELESWESSALGDPRRWVDGVAKPAVAVTAGAAAGAALVALRVVGGRSKRRKNSRDPLDYAEQTARAVADEARKLLDR
jgi:hypothetical protein